MSEQVKQWHERTNDLSDQGCIAALKEEVVELRAALAVESAALADAVRHVGSLKDRLAAQAPSAPVAREVDMALYLAANNLVSHIGAKGEIESDHPFVGAVMRALHDIDGGKLPVGAEQNARDAERYRYIRDTDTLDLTIWEALEGHGSMDGEGNLDAAGYRVSMDQAVDAAMLAAAPTPPLPEEA